MKRLKLAPPCEWEGGFSNIDLDLLGDLFPGSAAGASSTLNLIEICAWGLNLSIGFREVGLIWSISAREDLRLQEALREYGNYPELLCFELLPVFRQHLFDIASLAKSGEEGVVKHIRLISFSGLVRRNGLM
jgi:hypothetical protein